MMKVLAIGNSFSQDATCYLHQVLAAAGVETKIVNLYIGGCSLEHHWENIEKDAEKYQYQLNGALLERYVTIDEVLDEENWDYITVQQVSGCSGWRDTYEPFLGLILKYLQNRAPQAKFLLHETWAYEMNSDHGHFLRYDRDQQTMYERLKSCYQEMAQKYQLELIPCGDVIQQVRTLPEFCVQAGGLSLCRDGFHMSYVYGRYLTACVWAKKLAGISLKNNGFVPVSVYSDEQADEKLLAVIRNAVDSFE